MAGTTANTANRAPPAQRSPVLHPLLVIALAVPLLAGAWYARQMASDIVGPLAIAAGDPGVAVLAPGVLYRLDHTGKLQSVDTETVADGIRDGGLAVVGDTLLVSPGVDDDLLRCTAEGCAPFSDDNYAPTGPVQTYFDGIHFWFSETDADRIQRYDSEGKRIDMPVSDLASPGSLWLTEDQLFVADTGGRKIVRYRVHKRGIAEPETFATFSDDDAEDPVDAPTRFLPVDDGFRAIFSNAGRDHGVLVAIDNAGDAAPVDVEGLVNPVGVAQSGDALLVLDEETMQVFRQEADGSSSVFGDDDFRAQLAEGQSLRHGLRLAVPVLFALGVLAIAIGGSWLLKLLTYKESDPALAVAPDSDGIIWLPAECDLAPKRIPRFLIIAAPAALVPATALLLTTPYAGIAVAWVVLCTIAALFVPVTSAMRANLPKGERIGVRDRQLIVTHPEHGMREFPLPKVEWNEYLLRPEPGLDIALQRNGVTLYHASTVEDVLLPRLNLMRKIEH